MKELHEMTPAELADVQARAAALLGQQAPPPDDQDAEGLVWRALRDECAKLSVTLAPIPVVKKARHYTKWRGAARDTLAFTKQHLRTSTRAETMLALSWVAEAATHYLRKREVPLSHAALTNVLASPADLIEDQFPGYLTSGLLPAIMRQATRRV